MSKYKKYSFHPQLEIYRCGGGAFIGSIHGNRISCFEESLDDQFASFILQSVRENKVFSVQDMMEFFPKSAKYNFGEILKALEEKGLARALEDQKEKSLIFVNLTDIPDQDLINLSAEAGLESRLIWIEGLKLKNGESLSKKLDQEEKDNQVVFVLSDLHYKPKVSELNLYFFKKNRFWCPIIIDDFGGYIGPLIHSTSSGPCFECYQEKIFMASSQTPKLFSAPILLNIFLRAVFLEILKLGTDISPSPIKDSHLLEIDGLNHRSRKHYIYARSDCPLCGV